MKIDGMPVDMQIAAAVAKKAQSVQKLEGQAALQLIEGSAVAPPATSPDGRGALINTKA